MPRYVPSSWTSPHGELQRKRNSYKWLAILQEWWFFYLYGLLHAQKISDLSRWCRIFLDKIPTRFHHSPAPRGKNSTGGGSLDHVTEVDHRLLLWPLYQDVNNEKTAFTVFIFVYVSLNGTPQQNSPWVVSKLRSSLSPGALNPVYKCNHSDQSVNNCTLLLFSL